MKKDLNVTLITLILGIVLYFMIVSIPVLIIAEDKLYAEIGLFSGVVIGILRLVHMNAVIQHSMYMEKNHKAYITANSIGRLVIVLGILIVTVITGWTSYLTMLIGMIGEKLSALLNPLITKVFQKIIK